MPGAMVGERVAAELGFIMREPDAGGEPPSPRAVVAAPTIAGVLKASAAEKAGLEVGDVILQVNDQPVLTRDAAREALADVALDRPMRLTVRRGDTRSARDAPQPGTGPGPAVER